jgi:8-oxo-dGTP pyrophosphatase MutT (NUDIX family)
MTQLVVGAVIVNNGRAFVHRRGYDRSLFAGCWDIPGGHAAPGESALDALRRELEEETGWQLRRVITDLGEVSWIGSDGDHAASSTIWSRSRAICRRRASNDRSTWNSPGSASTSSTACSRPDA